MRFSTPTFRDAGFTFAAAVFALASAFASAELAQALTGAEETRISVTALALSD